MSDDKALHQIANFKSTTDITVSEFFKRIGISHKTHASDFISEVATRLDIEEKDATALTERDDIFPHRLLNLQNLEIVLSRYLQRI